VDRIENLESKFRFVHAAARRARQLQNGARPLVPSGTRKPTRVAMEEVLSGAVTFETIPEATQATAPE
jgi:DNA-directed RNA polymerase subunit omega